MIYYIFIVSYITSILILNAKLECNGIEITNDNERDAFPAGYCINNDDKSYYMQCGYDKILYYYLYGQMDCKGDIIYTDTATNVFIYQYPLHDVKSVCNTKPCYIILENIYKQTFDTKGTCNNMYYDNKQYLQTLIHTHKYIYARVCVCILHVFRFFNEMLRC